MCMIYSFLFLSFSLWSVLGCFHQTLVRILYLSALFHWGFCQLQVAVEDRDLHTEKESLHEYLFHYETLSKSNLSVEVRRQRDVDTGHVRVGIHVGFFTLGKNFNLVLKAGSPVMKPGFEAFTVDRHGKHSLLDVDPGNFFTGHLQENQSIPVDAHYEDGLLCTTIHFPNETYFTEPSWRHLPGSNEYDLISYRLSDVNWSSVGHLPPPLTVLSASQPLLSNSSASVNEQYPTFKNGKQRRDASDVRNTCPLKLVGDYVFFREYSGGVAVTAAHTMLNTMQQVNRIFQGTPWNLRNSLGWGFAVKKLLVHTEYSTGPAEGAFSYNYRQTWTAMGILEAFSMSDDLESVCLAHLFTSNIFKYDTGAVGLGYRGNPSRTGGICSLKVSFSYLSRQILPRTSWSSSINEKGRYLLRPEHQLVTAHELGHNWGSPHDPSGTCAPSDEQGGQYLMYQYNVGGLQPNNFRFSSCSIDFISQTLKSASYECFTGGEDVILCGNGIVDVDEECDAGVNGLIGKDQCCTSTCTLKTSALCSDFNSPCCRNCSVARAGTICGTTSAIRCVQASQCDGIHLSCPPYQPAANGTACLDGGICERGRCVTYCEILGRSLNKNYTSCMCQQSATAACMRCCMEVLGDNTNGLCLPTNQSLGTGRRCFNGECDKNGICIPVEVTYMVRLARLFDHFDFNTAAELMKTNMVMTIMLLTALIWIPASCYASYVDMKKQREEKEREERIAMILEILRSPPQHVDDAEDQEEETNTSEGGD